MRNSRAAWLLAWTNFLTLGVVATILAFGVWGFVASHARIIKEINQNEALILRNQQLIRRLICLHDLPKRTKQEVEQCTRLAP